MIPFQSQVISAVVGAVLAAWLTYSYCDTKADLASAKVTVASQQVQAKAKDVVLEKTEKAAEITVNNTAQLQQELLDAKDKINHLQRGLANGSIGMRVSVLANSCKDTRVPDAPGTSALPETITAELDPKTASDLVDIAAEGDRNATYYNALIEWIEAQSRNQQK